MSTDTNRTAPDDVVIRIENAGKCYHMYGKPSDRLKQAFFLWKRTYFKEFWAVRGVSIEIRRGEAVGIVGRNGSGKSTLLQMIAGIVAPTEGRVHVAGRIAALLELGSGFNPEFTGRENVYLNAAILGLSQAEIDDRFDSIASFADIGPFIDQPIKTYSSGMLVKLAFSVQAQVEPDVLIVDEALAVGDSLFQKRCYERIESLRAAGTTLLFVSHDQESIRTLTDRALLLDHGKVRMLGSSAEVILDYRRLLYEDEKAYFQNQTKHLKDRVRAESASGPPAPTLALGDAPTSIGSAAPKTTSLAAPPPIVTTENKPRPSRTEHLAFGGFDAEVVQVEVVDGEGNDASVFHPNQMMAVRITCRVNKVMNHLNVAFRIRNKQGMKITSWGTLNDDIRRWASGETSGAMWDRSFAAGEVFTVVFESPCSLGNNLYEVQATITQENDRYYASQRILHWRDEAAFFTVYHRVNEYLFGGVCDLRMSTRVLSESPTVHGGVA